MAGRGEIYGSATCLPYPDSIYWGYFKQIHNPVNTGT